MLAGTAGCSSSNMSSVDPFDMEIDTNMVAYFGQSMLDLSDFEEQYARSVGNREIAAGDSIDLYVDFLDRYVDFRLKVMYAQELGLDEDSSLIDEINTYRKQLARPYLLEKEILDPILRDLYDKKQNMVDASHILVRVGRAAGPEEVDAAFDKISLIKDSVDMGLDFGDLAYRNSEDPSARGARIGAKGRLGYFVGGQMVKEFEDQAYATPVDSVSNIFRSDFGYHIMKVHDRKERVQDVWASHIAVRHARMQSSDPADTLTAEERIALIKARLDRGEDFVAVAGEVSEDLDSRARGGQIGRLTYTQQNMPEGFKEALFNLKEPGDYSDVVRTDYGFHIVRLDKRAPNETFEESYDELKTQASRLPRVKQAETAMAMQIREKYGISVDTMLTLEILDGRHFGAADILTLPQESLQMQVASIGDRSFKFKDIVDFAETASIPFKPDTLGLVLDALDRFLNDEALNYEASKLEARDQEFKRILDEFQNGLLLFKLMEDSVWTAAAQDTAGLMAYHAPRADSFWYGDRTRIISFRSRSDSLLKSVTARLDDGMPLANLIDMIEDDSTMNVRIDTTYLEGPNNSVFDKALALDEGKYTQPIKNSNAFLVMVNQGIEKARQKTFQEARSEVLNAYQTIIEENLVGRLRKKYNAKKFYNPLENAFEADKKALAAAPKVVEDLTAPSGQ